MTGQDRIDAAVDELRRVTGGVPFVLDSAQAALDAATAAGENVDLSALRDVGAQLGTLAGQAVAMTPTPLPDPPVPDGP